MSAKFRPYQIEIDDAIYNELSKENKCIVKAFCGTGKSNIMAYGKAFQNHNLKVYVFPSLSLIDQFNIDYLNECKNKLIISSESTTDPKTITTFMKKTANKTICITYNSFYLLNEYKINMCVFDEAHHAIGETYQELIFNNINIEKCCFFTATPKTANGIDMLKDCGKIVYDYPYLRGVAEGYLNPFEIRVDLFGENTNNTIYDSIARAYYKTGNNRILTFHSDVNTESPTSVRNFVNKTQMIDAFKRVVKEFSNIDVPTITMLGFYSELKLTERRDILKEFDTSKDVFILSSCETMGEGIDTKNANMCVFVDPKTSFVKIIQNIGRVVRKQFNVDKPHSTILLPIYINKTKYEECKTAEECDAVIREKMKKGEDFTPILNVMSALKQEDEDLYDICLYYPNNYSPKELEHNFKAKGYTIGEEQELEEIFDDDLEEVAERDDIQIDIHTDSLEEPIISYGESERVVSILQVEDKYCKIEGEEKAIKPPKRIRLDVHTNMDIQVLWKIENIDLGSCLLDCEVNDNWEERLEELREFLDREKRRPICKYSKEKIISSWLNNNLIYFKNKTYNLKNENKYILFDNLLKKYSEIFVNNDEIFCNKLKEVEYFINEQKRKPTHKENAWLYQQQKNYKLKQDGMKNKERYDIFTQFLKKYELYLKSKDEIWFETLIEYETYLNNYKQRPKINTKEEDEPTFLARWYSNQQKNYKLKQDGMKNKERYDIFTQFLNKYEKYLKTKDEIWDSTLIKLQDFIKQHLRRPYEKSKTSDTEKILGTWLTSQIQNYNKINNNMKDKILYDKFTQFLKDYAIYFKSLDEQWIDNLTNLKKMILKIKKKPNQRIDAEKTMALFYKTNNTIYNKNVMNHKERCKQWEEFLEEYKEYLNPKKSMSLKTTKEPIESTEQKRQRIKTEISELHQKYKTLTSANLSKLFEDKTKWEHYHTISERNEDSFPKESIPRNQIITELDKIKTKRPKKVVDMGCGKANISKHFNGDKRFEFTNYDHVANDDSVEVCDISRIPLEDDSAEICILSLAMWGSNCKEYIKEAQRILETNGTLYIIEPTKRWTNDQPADRLRDLLGGFKIIKETIEKFTMFIAIKI